MKRYLLPIALTIALLALWCLLYLSASASTIVNLPPGCTVNGSATVSVTCDSQPIPPPTSYCRNIANAAAPTRPYIEWTGYQTVYYRTSVSAKTVDVTKFASTWGPWPGTIAGVSTWFPLPTNRYLSQQFVATAGHAGQYWYQESGYTAPFSMTISTGCGDFSNPTIPGSTVVPGCWRNNKAAPNAVPWATSGLGACVLRPGTTYYLNVINADVGHVGAGATGSATSSANARCSTYCTDPIQASYWAQ